MHDGAMGRRHAMGASLPATARRRFTDEALDATARYASVPAPDCRVGAPTGPAIPADYSREAIGQAPCRDSALSPFHFTYYGRFDAPQMRIYGGGRGRRSGWNTLPLVAALDAVDYAPRRTTCRACRVGHRELSDHKVRRA